MQIKLLIRRLNILKSFMVLSLVIGLCSCGFQLRGYQQSDLNNIEVFIQAPLHLSEQIVYQRFDKHLKQQLTLAGAQFKSIEMKIVEEEKPLISLVNFVFLKLNQFKFSTQGFSRDATGRANEQELTLRLAYSIETGTGLKQNKLAIGPEEMVLSLSGNYYQDYQNPVAGELQKSKLQQQLIQQISQKLVRQIEIKTAQGAMP